MTLRRGSRGRQLLLRSRIALTTACIVATAIMGLSTVTWFATRYNLRAQLDQTLLEKQLPRRMIMLGDGSQLPPPAVDMAALCETSESDNLLRQFLEGIQVLHANGGSCAPSGVDLVKADPADHAITAVTLRDGETESGAAVRVVLRPIGNGDVVVISRSLADIDDTLAGLRDVLIVVCFLGAVAAAVTGLLMARRSLAPMERLTKTAEHIARTEDLETPVDIAGHDEVGRLGRAFTAMTVALRDSRHRQHQLVNDAAHELRTPLTSLRTNVDLLARSEYTGRAIPVETRARILDRLQVQTREFSDLVGELVELARDGTELANEEVPIPAVVDRAVRRAASRSPEHSFDVHTSPWSVAGDAVALERTVLNLLDNAAKFSPARSVITVRSDAGWLTVTDQGPGVPQRQRRQVFERFWRAPGARALPGSGLGLAIVANTVTAHGGTVRFADPPSGSGACVRIDLPAASGYDRSG
ncbi:sensor histidine kinase [Amycolatopsis nigrescens]|uniref:sensor histidine kinase n=1 Tax=Amycolatopsis nigrescens TaxID=381445 RepID=UPI000590AE21|nr:HAMP domain-containing sensor histidine kinase [Amycolatopsis nigrescens]